MKIVTSALVIVSFALLTGCANWTAPSRMTTQPFPSSVPDTGPVLLDDRR